MKLDTTRTRRLAIRTALLILLLTVALPASATHRFRDVPTNSYYHEATANLDATGLTAGCDSDRFCPNQTLPRWQMAIFLNRIAGRSASNSSVGRLTAASGGGLGGTPVTVEIVAGGVSGGTGGATLTGNVTVMSTGDVSPCPCEVEAFVYRVRDKAKGPESWGHLPAQKANGRASVSLPVSWNLTISSGRTEVYAVGVFVNGAAPTSTTAEATLTAEWTPYRNR